MRKPIALLFSLILLLFTVLPVAAVAKEYEFSGISFVIDNSYSVNTDEDLAPSSSVKGLLFVAISEDSKHQIQCRQTETEFSRELISFENLDKESIAPAAEELFPNGYETATINGVLYLKGASIENGEASVVYVTVAEGKLYTFSYFGTDASVIGEFMSTVKFPEKRSNSWLYTLMIVLISLILIGFVVFTVFLITSFVKDYRRKKMEMEQNIVSQYIKIKRRKY